jgi:hypothetical protein
MAKSGHNAAGFRKLQKSGFARFFQTSCDTVSFNITKTVANVTICDFVKSSHNEDSYRKLQKAFLSWLFVTIWDLVHSYTSLA